MYLGAVNDPTNLDEVVVTAQPRAVAPVDDMPEIVVQGKRIPWYVWMLGGAALVAVYMVMTEKRR